MSKIIASLFITLDGVVEAPEKWNPPYHDDEMSRAVLPRLAGASAHLYGRCSYELFRRVFTGPAAPPHAAMMTGKPKIVVSATLDRPDWGPATLLSGDVSAGLTRLKQQAGGDIVVGASGTLVRYLLAEALLDELQLFVHPVIVGAGKRLFGKGDSAPLRLLESRTHGNGVIALTYTRDVPGPPKLSLTAILSSIAPAAGTDTSVAFEFAPPPRQRWPG